MGHRRLRAIGAPYKVGSILGSPSDLRRAGRGLSEPPDQVNRHVEHRTEGEMYPEWEPENREDAMGREADRDLPARGEEPVDDPGDPAGGVSVGGVRRHWGALQRSGYDAPRRAGPAGTGRGTFAARLAQGLEGLACLPGNVSVRSRLEGTAGGMPAHHRRRSQVLAVA